MGPEGSSRTPNLSRFNWVVQLVLSSVCFALWIVGAAHHYPWFITGGVAAVSLFVGFIFIPTKLLLAKPNRGFALSIGVFMIIVGALSAWALARFAPGLLDGVLVALGGLWFSTSARGTLENERPVNFGG